MASLPFSPNSVAMLLAEVVDVLDELGERIADLLVQLIVGQRFDVRYRPCIDRPCIDRPCINQPCINQPRIKHRPGAFVHLLHLRSPPF